MCWAQVSPCFTAICATCTAARGMRRTSKLHECCCELLKTVCRRVQLLPVSSTTYRLGRPRIRYRQQADARRLPICCYINLYNAVRTTKPHLCFTWLMTVGVLLSSRSDPPTLSVSPRCHLMSPSVWLACALLVHLDKTDLAALQWQVSSGANDLDKTMSTSVAWARMNPWSRPQPAITALTADCCCMLVLQRQSKLRGLPPEILQWVQQQTVFQKR